VKMKVTADGQDYEKVPNGSDQVHL
jgi:hypothetical protein